MTDERPADRVVLLHGLGRTSVSMLGLARHLERRGFDTCRIGYPSRSATVSELARYVSEALRARLDPGGGPVHFVTHSMGGIVLRALHEADPLPRIGRAVMLCPPNRGSEVARRLSRWSAVRRVLGPALADLQPGSAAVRSRPDFEVGVIAGERAWIPFVGQGLAGAHDGIVGVEETRLEGMTDFLVVPRGHTFLMDAPEVRFQIVAYLREGRFRHRSGDSSASNVSR